MTQEITGWPSSVLLRILSANHGTDAAAAGDSNMPVRIVPRARNRVSDAIPSSLNRLASPHGSAAKASLNLVMILPFGTNHSPIAVIT